VNGHEDETALRARVAAAEARAAAAEAEAARLRHGPTLPAAAPAPVLARLDGDGVFAIAKVCLWLQFGCWVVLVLVSVPGYIAIAHDELPFGRSMPPTIQGLLMAAIVDVFFAPTGITALSAALGIRRAKRWAWGVGVAAGALGILFCLPLGAVILIAFVRENVRHAFFPERAPPTWLATPPVGLGPPYGRP
jgi:hypothetical protein